MSGWSQDKALLAGLMISIHGQVQTQIQGKLTQVNADAMLVLKGGITMVN